MNDPIIDIEWRKLVARASAIFENDSDAERVLLDDYATDIKPIGCYPQNNSDIAWVAKIYLGGKQRIICTGSVYQCARVYDVVYFRFRPYRVRPEPAGQIFNCSEQRAGDDNINADAVAVLCDMEQLLRSRGLLHTLAERKSAQQTRANEYRHKTYTAAGRVEGLIEQLFGIIEAQSEVLHKMTRQLDELVTRHSVPVLQPPPLSQPTPFWPSKPSPYVGDPGYTAPYIGDDLNAPKVTCKAGNNVQ